MVVDSSWSWTKDIYDHDETVFFWGIWLDLDWAKGKKNFARKVVYNGIGIQLRKSSATAMLPMFDVRLHLFFLFFGGTGTALINNQYYVGV
jgi:hypothetical protein